MRHEFFCQLTLSSRGKSFRLKLPRLSALARLAVSMALRMKEALFKSSFSFLSGTVFGTDESNWRSKSSTASIPVLIPSSKIKISIAKVLKDEGFIKDYEVIKGDTPQRVIKTKLKYTKDNKPVLKGLKRVSKPSLRVYAGKGEIPRVFGGLGIAIISTPRGIMTGKQAWHNGIGGEVLCYAW